VRDRISHLLYYVLCSEDVIGFTIRLMQGLLAVQDIISVRMARGAIGLE